MYITGKGRCNVTNNCNTEELFKAVINQPQISVQRLLFLYTPGRRGVFEEAGVPLKKQKEAIVYSLYPTVLLILSAAWSGN